MLRLVGTTQPPFILVTGSQSGEVAVACIKEGADDYILKASLKRLPSAVLGALKKREAEQERARAELALRRSEEHFRSLIENSSDIITIIGRDGTISYESPSLERVLGYKPDKGTRFRINLPIADSAESQAALRPRS